MTSWPASAARAAATAESTPPDMAASTRIGVPAGSWRTSDLVGRLTVADAVLAGPPGALDDRADRLGDGVDVGLGGGVAEREAQRPAGQRLGHAHRQQHVARLRDPGRAGRAGRALDAAGVEQQQQRVALAAGEGEVRVAGQPVLRRQAAGHR